MPKSATGISTSRPAGFTLLEVMVTLVLIGIIAGFAVLSIPGGGEGQPLSEEAERLLTLLELNREEAVLLGEQRGVVFTETGYQFVSYDPGSRQWAPPRQSGLRQSHDLPADMRLQLWTEGRPVDFDKTPEGRPQLLLLSSGETTEFVALFRLEDSRHKGYRVIGDLTGQMIMEAVQ
jgi:general secretion pathway protein H